LQISRHQGKHLDSKSRHNPFKTRLLIPFLVNQALLGNQRNRTVQLEAPPCSVGSNPWESSPSSKLVAFSARTRQHNSSHSSQAFSEISQRRRTQASLHLAAAVSSSIPLVRLQLARIPHLSSMFLEISHKLSLELAHNQASLVGKIPRLPLNNQVYSAKLRVWRLVASCRTPILVALILTQL